MCRQCPGFRREVGQLLFAATSNFWPGLQPPPPPPPPRPPPPPPAKPAAAEEAEEGSSSPAAVDQPSTSSESPSGDDRDAPTFLPSGAPPFSRFTNVHVSLSPCGGQLLRSTAAPRRATISSAPAASSRCLTDGLSSTLSRLILSNVSSSPSHTQRLLPFFWVFFFGFVFFKPCVRFGV